MLKRLQIDNFAIIDHIDLEFKSGLTVLTGETGAGKSILIDAIALLFGERANQEMIRSGAQNASVSGLFVVDREELRTEIIRQGIDLVDDEILISRAISSEKSNTVRVNNQAVTLSQLKAITSRLADIHSQFDTQSLINPDNYLALLDGFNSTLLASARSAYDESLLKLKRALAGHKALNERQMQFAKLQDLYRFQLDELLTFDLEPETFNNLTSEISVLENYDKVYETLARIRAIMTEADLIDNLHEVMTGFDRMQTYGEEYKDLYQKTAEYYYELKEIASLTSLRLDELSYDPERLNMLQEQLYSLQKLTEKYHKDIDELRNYRTELQSLVAMSEDFPTEIKKSEAQIRSLFDQTASAAKDLSKIRQEIALKVTKELMGTFSDLSLPNTLFKIEFIVALPKDISEADKFSPDGIDKLDFLISTNVGEPLKPLAKVASGGEMSRVMLAFKTIFIRSRHLSTMIFDEIDTGISGKIAKQVARKIKEISKNCQVLSITHIPQVVATGDHHLRISKTETDKRTSAQAAYLDFEGRVMDIAMMISGDRPSSSSIANAKELLMEN